MATQENISFIVSAATTGLYMAGIIILTIGLLTTYWKLITYFGRPWGVFITKLAPLPKDGNILSERQSTRQPARQSDRAAGNAARSERTQLESTLAGMIGVFLWITAAGVEIVRTTTDEQVAGTADHWNMRMIFVLLLKSGLEGLIATFTSAAVIRLVGWAKTSR